MPTANGQFVGIDLGTTNSSLAYLDAGGRPVSLINRDGQPVTPSAVYLRRDEAIVAGAEAVEASKHTPDRVARHFKRNMGERHYARPVAGRQVSPEWLSAIVLRRLAEDFQNQLAPVAGVVITVPAYFGDTRRKATVDAGTVAGLSVVDIINEPTAAALANAYLSYIELGGRPDDISTAQVATTAPSTTLVYDLGGGTFDVTAIRIEGNNFAVLATGGEVRLGGIDWDARLMDYAANEFCRRVGVDPRDDRAAGETLRLNCEAAKKQLSRNAEARIPVAHMGKAFSVGVTRQQFEAMTRDLLTRTELSTQLLLEEASLKWDDIDELLLVGGASRMPMVPAMLRRISRLEPRYSAQPEQIVAHGAAIHAAICKAQRSTMTQPLGERVLKSDETDVVAAIDGGVPVPERAGTAFAPDVKLINVNPHSLGVAARNLDSGMIVNSRLIARNTSLPSMRSKVFGTEEANQRIVRVRVIEGEAREAEACTQIGECVIASLPEGLPRGAPVEVIFLYNASGRIHVRAVEKSSGTQAECYIERDTGLKDDQMFSLSDDMPNLVIL